MSDTVLWIRQLPVGFALALALLFALAALTTLFLGRRPPHALNAAELDLRERQ